MIVFHGTNKYAAVIIARDGFMAGTHFARHLEDALEFGGSWVFMVDIDDRKTAWQFVSNEYIPVSWIKRLTQYRPIVRIGTQPHLTRKIDSRTESRNLIGVPLLKGGSDE